MADDNMTSIKLTIKADDKTYFSTTDINPSATDAELNVLAGIINSFQNAQLDTVIKTTEHLLLPA